MTPAERALVTELFDRLASLETTERDPEAERLIRDRLQHAPNAPYSLVQTMLLQDEALKRADVRIQELERGVGGGTAPGHEAGFLDSMRDALLGRRDPPRAGSVPSVRSSDASPGAVWGGPSGPRPGAPLAPSEPMRPGGSFLGTAAAAAVGVIGGSLLADSMRGMMGGHGRGHSAFDPGGGGSASPWGGSAGGGELSRQAGVDDIGRSSSGHDDGGRHGMFDTAAADPADVDDQELDDMDAGDFDDDSFDSGGGDSDTA